MNEIIKGGNNFVGYEYKEVIGSNEKTSLYLDGYMNFGWIIDENAEPVKAGGRTTIKLKRDRKINNKTELTRLQRHFEACVDDIESLEKSETSSATMLSITVGIIGTVFMALSVFAVTNDPPKILACILFAIPAFIGWIFPYFIFKYLVGKRTAQIMPLIEQKYDEIYDICEKGNNLINSKKNHQS